MGWWDCTVLQTNQVKLSINGSTDFKLWLFSKLNPSEGKTSNIISYVNPSIQPQGNVKEKHVRGLFDLII